jgi:hypothetical protein
MTRNEARLGWSLRAEKTAAAPSREATIMYACCLPKDSAAARRNMDMRGLARRNGYVRVSAAKWTCEGQRGTIHMRGPAQLRVARPWFERLWRALMMSERKEAGTSGSSALRL